MGKNSLCKLSGKLIVGWFQQKLTNNSKITYKK
jgi:hypothetical protein